MDFEKEYNDMVQRARELHEAGNALTKKQMEIVCPQLAESEDERIVNWLYDMLKRGIENAPKDCPDNSIAEKALAWLEKQKEHKPAEKQEWSEEDERVYDILLNKFKQLYDCLSTSLSRKDIIDIYNFVKSLRPQPSWKPSEDQMDALKELIDDANKAGWVTPGATELYEQLKKL